MIPEKFKNYTFNENDFLPEGYQSEDKEKEALVRKLAFMISDDITFRKEKDITNDDPDFWLLDRLLTKEEVRLMLSFKKKRVVKLTLEEIAEVMSAVYLGHMDAPCIIYDLNGYYEGLRIQLAKMAETGLSNVSQQRQICFARNLEEIRAAVEER